jgi:hypothetical protein
MFGRMTRQQWFGKAFPAIIGRPSLPKQVKLPKLPKTLDTFEVNLYDEASKRYKKVRVKARTKSEARAQLKVILQSRIPPGTILVKLT